MLQADRFSARAKDNHIAIRREVWSDLPEVTQAEWQTHEIDRDLIALTPRDGRPWLISLLVLLAFGFFTYELFQIPLSVAKTGIAEDGTLRTSRRRSPRVCRS